MNISSAESNITSSNSITVVSWSDNSLSLTIQSQLVPQFKDLINRALNCFPDAHPELKELGDILTEGKVLQDYASQK